MCQDMLSGLVVAWHGMWVCMCQDVLSGLVVAWYGMWVCMCHGMLGGCVVSVCSVSYLFVLTYKVLRYCMCMCIKEGM